MRNNLGFGLTCLAVLLLTGCSQIGVPNPFATVSDVKEVYYREFTDIPVPAEMKGVPSGTMVTPTQDGVKVGLETLEGRVEPASLANAMIHNMARQGWSLRGSVTGKRTLQLHEKDSRFAVIAIQSGTINTSMEIWVLNRLSSGGFGSVPLSGGATMFSPSPSSPSSSSSSGQGGVTSQSLSN